MFSKSSLQCCRLHYIIYCQQFVAWDTYIYRRVTDTVCPVIDSNFFHQINLINCLLSISPQDGKKIPLCQIWAVFEWGMFFYESIIVEILKGKVNILLKKYLYRRQCHLLNYPVFNVDDYSKETDQFEKCCQAVTKSSQPFFSNKSKSFLNTSLNLSLKGIDPSFFITFSTSGMLLVSAKTKGNTVQAVSTA